MHNHSFDTPISLGKPGRWMQEKQISPPVGDENFQTWCSLAEVETCEGQVKLDLVTQP